MILRTILCMLAFLHVCSAAAMLRPKLSTASRELRLKEGQTEIVLACTLDIGDDPIAYRWLKQLKLVTAELGYAYRSGRQVMLALHAISREHAGRYECEATNDAGVDAASIDIIVEHSDYGHGGYQDTASTPNIANTLSELATSLNDVLAEGGCECDMMFLMHASPDAKPETMKFQANLVYTIASGLISDSIRVAVMTYSDYVDTKMNFGKGTNKCALRDAFQDLSHSKYATRIEPVLIGGFKKFKKSKKQCKVMLLPILSSLGPEGVANVDQEYLKKSGVTLFVLEITDMPIPGVDKMASRRGDGKPYHWRLPLKGWLNIINYMNYMPEELAGCMDKQVAKPGVCVAAGTNCTLSSECEGIGFGCVQGICQSLDCNVSPHLPGCCTNQGDFWCGDVTYDCKSKKTICDGKIQCMNGLDEDRCWKAPCSPGQARCQTSVLCISVNDLCDGEFHCPGAEDEDPDYCRAFPCPSDRFFRCRDGKCITPESLCDGTFKDCTDGEDENLEYCSQKHVCSASRPFSCDYGVCKSDRIVCDGAYNCLDASDEKDCKSKMMCPHDRPFKCDNGDCVALDKICNGIVDVCPDGSDEKNCTSFVCPSKRSFKCRNGRCIDRWLKCNNNNECGDNSDELNCNDITTSTTLPPVSLRPTTPKPMCLDDEFFCTGGICLSRSKVCDGNYDCPSGEDEDKELCAKTPCPPSRPHRCPGGICVMAVLCDGNSDCPDGSDEEDCFDNDYSYEEYDEFFQNNTTPSTPKKTPDVELTLVEEPEPEPEAEPERTQSEDVVSSASNDGNDKAKITTDSATHINSCGLLWLTLALIFTPLIQRPV